MTFEGLTTPRAHGSKRLWWPLARQIRWDSRKEPSSIVDVDGPANGAPNPGFTPRVSWRSVTLTERERRCQPITVNFDNSMPRSPVSSKSALRHSFAADAVRDSSNVPNDTVQHRTATQTPVGQRGVDQILLVQRTTRGEVSIVFLHAHTWVTR
jgi:hypothetical protein